MSQAYVLGGALVLVAGLAIVGVVSTTGAPRRATAVPATPERTPAPARPDHAPTARAQEIAQHVARLQGAGGDPCRAAAALADLGARDQVPELIRFVDDAADSQHQVCGAHALVRLGEGLAMLPSFVDWSEGDDEQLIDGAIVGFGLIGPSAAHEAIPILRAALVAGPSPADRNRIVATLARLGPAAAPVLQLAVDDEDAQVRTAAQAALERLR